MRTTLTLDVDVARKVAELRHRSRRSLKDVINQALRAGLALESKPAPRRKRFRVQPHRCGFRPGVDPERLNQLLDQLDTEDFAASARASDADRPAS